MLSLLRSSAGNETQEIFSERITIAYAQTKINIHKNVQKYLSKPKNTIYSYSYDFKLLITN